VKELMTSPATTCDPDDEITGIMSVMTLRRVRHVPVVAAGELCGVVSIGDVVKHRLDEIQLEVNVLRDHARTTVR
jgi:signal-transduction protein with cAMP-binding, CBS, and nucleotidyltransferase domain